MKQARGVNLTSDLGHGESLFETVRNFFVPDMPRSQHEAVLACLFWRASILQWTGGAA